MRYAIFEGNMERLTKKMTRIQNKCKKYGCAFTFNEVGEEFRELKDEDGRAYTARFVLVEAEGIARVNGWQFAASIEHTKKGNILSKAVEVEVPERYYTGAPYCEHCGNKNLKYAYIVYNEETGEFKQVGRNCLCDFTHGMSAAGVAQYMSAFEELIEGEAPAPGCHHEWYYDTEEYLRYAWETIRHFGYVKTANRDDWSTRDRALAYYEVEHGGYKGIMAEVGMKYRAQMDAVGFNAKSPEAANMTAKAIEWLETQAETSNYMHNLKTACALDYVTGANLGLVASLFPAFNRELERVETRRRKEEAEKKSEWVGEVGKRIELKPVEVICVTGWETQWGYTCIYKIVDEAGNIYTWKTTKGISDNVKKITGTVKAHNEYRGTKQTELTRCKCAC